MSAPLLHRPPRRPRAWAWLFGTSQLAVVALWIWAGWHWGLPALLLTHAAMVWGTLKPQSRLFGPVLTRLPVDEPAAWLTIDDGPSDDTEAILDLLDAHHARATFFLVAARAQARPALVREIVRRGHTIGNHSLDHPSARFWMLGPRALARQIGEAQAVLAGLAGQPPRWFRAVVGMANPFVAAVLKRQGLARVAWCTRGFDTVEQDPAIVVTRLEGGLRPGAIVLLHEGAAHGRSVEALALWLRRMDELGYRSVLPEDLEAG
ncbi:polysaccharide deacetylase family protein [Marilutibacter chinensis]|uniref:Polysaccharide deacetylase family protein n=1 Tax=Marilutibacter chinensis TaxID=2912247 RepID=A0ABS9HUY7_9GAMM|nr:polysaccharide deacetylase family protein [Lysobacter chinensis]MCF7222192.1 polysaccharide deacetylase family protein [Lysobacter chinensis]